MSAHPKNHENLSLLGESTVTKCIKKANLKKRSTKLHKIIENLFKKSELFVASGNCSWKLLGAVL